MNNSIRTLVAKSVLPHQPHVLSIIKIGLGGKTAYLSTREIAIK